MEELCTRTALGLLPYFLGAIVSCHLIHSKSIYSATSTLLLGLTSCSAILNALSCQASLLVQELAGVWIRLTSLCSHSSRRSRIFFSSEMYILATVSSLSSVNAQAQKTIKHHTRDPKTWEQQLHPQRAPLVPTDLIFHQGKQGLMAGASCLILNSLHYIMICKDPNKLFPQEKVIGRKAIKTEIRPLFPWSDLTRHLYKFFSISSF